jgi:DNA-directed RNA polymerase subunit delta
MANYTLLQIHPPRNDQSGKDTGWPEEEEYFDTAVYEDDLLGPDDWEDDEEDWEEIDDYDWEEDEPDDDWDDDDEDYDYDEDEDL